MAQFCTHCKQKIGMLSGYKCKDACFCTSCVSRLDKIYIDNLCLFMADQIEDILLLVDSESALVNNEGLKEILKCRIEWIKRKAASKADLDKIESSYRKECKEVNRYWDHSLQEVENDFKRFKNKNGGKLNPVQRQNYERMVQENQKFREEDIRDVQKNYSIDKETIFHFFSEASENVEKENEKLFTILEKIKEQAEKIREENNEKDDREQAKFEEEQEELKKNEEKLKWEAERQARLEKEEKAREEEKRKAQDSIDRKAKELAEQKIQEELEQIKITAEKKALEEAREKAELQAKQAAEKALKKAENEKRKASVKEERKKNPRHLAILSFICSIVSWPSIMLIYPPIPLAIAGIVLGIKGRKSEKKKLAMAGIIIGSLLILLYVVVGIAVI